MALVSFLKNIYNAMNVRHYLLASRKLVDTDDRLILLDELEMVWIGGKLL